MEIGGETAAENARNGLAMLTLRLPAGIPTTRTALGGLVAIAEIDFADRPDRSPSPGPVAVAPLDFAPRRPLSREPRRPPWDILKIDS